MTIFDLPEDLPPGVQWRRNSQANPNRQIWDLFISDYYQYLWIEHHPSKAPAPFCLSMWAEPFFEQAWYPTLIDASNRALALLVEHRMRGMTTITIGQFLQIQRKKHPT